MIVVAVEMKEVSAVSLTESLLVAVETKQVSAASLVPGDVLVLPPGGCSMMCDAVLLTGNAIVDEGMLTGTAF